LTALSTPWRTALGLLYAVPDPHRQATIDRREALEILHCDPDTLTALVEAGLPADGDGRGEGPLFDRHDLINLALNTGTGQTGPERALRYALRWMNEDPRSWQNPLDWTFDIELSCPDPEGCTAAGQWTHARLMPERSGGAITEWTAEPAERTDGDQLLFTGPGPVRLAGRMRTVGRLMELKSPQLRSITQDFVDAGYRWARLPKGVQADYRTVMANGYAPCVTASMFLAEQYRAAGYQAVTRSGWILGMLDLGHAWVEVIDDDGEEKAVDAVFHLLARLTGAYHPDLPSAAIGSRINRILPAGADAGRPLAEHACRGRHRIPDIRTVIRRAVKR
jgi:hypothetical protein